GSPLEMHSWSIHAPASLAMSSVECTHKDRNLRRDARVCVVAEAGSGGGDERGVTVLGKAEFLADGPERRALVERFHAKYPRLERLWGGRTMPPNRVMFRVAPAHVRSWGLE